MKALESIAALMAAENINMLDSEAVIASLSKTCAPSYNIRVYKDAQLFGKHISAIKPGDTVLHNGQVCTVTASNLSRGDFMGALLFGDSYSLGNKPVIVIANVRF